MIWTWDILRVDRIVENPAQRVLYYLVDGPQRFFVREIIMEISDGDGGSS